MAETEDPVSALASSQISVRCAGARDLALAGGPEHLERLLDLAVRDGSSGVRLGCAAAAADILSRHRLPPTRDLIPDATRRALFARVSKADPGINPGLFQVAGTLEIPEGVQRILLALRDPRADVRVGAVVGLYRLAVSATRNGDAELAAAVVGALSDTRIRPETRADLARVCANVGYAAALPVAEELAASTAKGVSAVAKEAVTRLTTAPAVDGMWVDLGIDAGEVREDARVREWVATVGDRVVRIDADRAWEEARREPRRFVWWKRTGETEAGMVLQEADRTLFAADADDQAHLGERLLHHDADALIDRIDPILPATGATLRLRGAVALRRGDVEGALVALHAAVEARRAPPDAWWYLADALHRAGRDAEARPHLEKYLSKAAKRAPFVAEAKARLG